jgi:hypothetical protein
LALEDILKSDLWLISELASAKQRLLEAKARAREKALDAEALKAKKK